MKVNSDAGAFQCYICGFMENDYSYFQYVDIESELICMGCYENYKAECDTMIVEDGDDYQ